MDFFSQQDASRRRTGWLVLYFILGVCATIAVVQVLVAAIVGGEKMAATLVMPDLFAGVATATSAVVLLSSLFKLLQLRRGGAVVAQQLDARLLLPATVEYHEKRLLNVVEEMALASGVPVPPVYVLDKEDGINAFAAGYHPDDAVIGVTRGLLMRLNREEQQGVIAHEFSHILNGDMRLNLKLLAMIHGLLFLSMLGYWILRVGLDSGRGRKRDAGLAVAAFGGGLFLIGQLSAFFGRIMQSAVSRQREFLADASAVQFTRNPQGLADALKKVGGHRAGAKIAHAAADELNHLFFATGRARWLSLLATHPPLSERILRLDPAFDGRLPDSVPVTGPVEALNQLQTPQLAARAKPVPPRPPPRTSASPPPLPAHHINTDPVQIDEMESQPGLMPEAVGEPMEEHLVRIRQILGALPPVVVTALQDGSGASAVVLGLLLSDEAPIRNTQMELLRRDAPDGCARAVALLEPELRVLPAPARLPLVDLALPSLRQMSPKQLEAFHELMGALMEADQQITLFEYALQHVLRRHLRAGTGEPRRSDIVIRGVRPVENEMSIVISLLARAGAVHEQDCDAAFRAGATHLALFSGRVRYLGPAESRIEQLHEALNRLALTTFRVRRALLEACTRTVAFDGRIRAEEAELLRVLADALDCPVPVWIRGAGEV